MSDETNKPRCVGTVSMDDKAWAQLMAIGKSSHVRVFHGNALYNQLISISAALQDMPIVRRETTEILAEAVERQVFGIVASLLGLGIVDKGGRNEQTNL